MTGGKVTKDHKIINQNISTPYTAMVTGGKGTRDYKIKDQNISSPNMVMVTGDRWQGHKRPQDNRPKYFHNLHSHGDR
jgi:hypothetical protein